MEIFSWIVTILEFIGILLLVIFGVLLFLLLLVLFGGIKYYIFAEKKEDVVVNFKVSFLGIIRFVFLYGKEKKASYLRIFGIKFFKNDFNEKEDDFEKSSLNLNENVSFENEQNLNVGSEQNVFEETKKDVLKENYKKKSKKENNVFNNVKNIYDKLIFLKEYPHKGDIARDTLNLIKQLFVAIMPKKCKVNLLVGFDDPSDTGKFIGLMSVVSEFAPFEINSFADFEREVFEGDLLANGKTRIFKIGFPILRYVLKEHILNIIKNRKG